MTTNIDPTITSTTTTRTTDRQHREHDHEPRTKNQGRRTRAAHLCIVINWSGPASGRARHRTRRVDLPGGGIRLVRGRLGC